jgi:3-deoxy-D-manno-octulosonate 8-phosphate phosphatase (KDO 8-P phosphatase)
MNATHLAEIRLLLLDVDGVLTDGRIVYADEGGESKSFHVRDGLGLRLLMENGIRVGLVTGRSSRALRHRCRDMGITLVFEGIREKADMLEAIARETGIGAAQTAFVGDDLLDIPIMRRVGLGVAVADAHPAVRSCAAMITHARGGYGAVREVCEALLEARGLWQDILARFEATAGRSHD